ncbi:MAG TPA: PQQ-binding-like beta-propeller repeat protein [Bryobacteraceae bacterium]|nr:PQQ-binding-like beta-propeller repeat protein [Bryobacteraceae bacterium]
MLRCRGVRLLFVLLGSLAWAADWPQWRGPNRDGISTETGLLDSWPKGGPPLVWKVPGLGEGYSSSAIAEGRLFIQGQHGDEEFVLAFDAATGRQVWRARTGIPFKESRGYGPRGTPTVDGGRVYALAADGMLVCLEAATGKTLWGFNIVDHFHAHVPHWGISESPLVDGDRVIVTPGGPGAAVVALDKMSGKPLWQSQSDPAGYSSPIAFDAGGTRELAVLTADAAIGLDFGSGKLLWRYERVANGTANIATPIVHNGEVFFSSDYGTGCVLLKVAAGGNASEVYFNRDMRNHYSTSVLIGDYLYGFSSSILTAMKFQTGEVAWRDRSVGKGSLIYADKHLYALGEDGVVGLVEATPAGYHEVSRFEIPKGAFPTWSQPVIANGRLYLREQDNLFCYNIKK